MKYQGKIQDPLDLVTKQYVDSRSGVKSVNGSTGDVTVTFQSLSDKPFVIPEAPSGGKMYARQSGAWTELPAFSNPNLLDNGWFVVNQRKAVNFADDYHVDRWRSEQASGSISTNGISLTSGYIVQFLEDDLWAWITGKNLTASVMTANGTIRSGQIQNFTPGATQTEFVGFEGSPFTVFVNPANKAIYVGRRDTSNRNIRAVKLEIGDISTISCDVMPDYSSELRKCQRYYYRIQAADVDKQFKTNVVAPATNGSTIYATFQLPVAMRDVPVISYSAVSDFSVTQSTGGAASTCTRIQIYNNSQDNSFIEVQLQASGLTATNFYNLMMQRNSWIAFAAEIIRE